jgi:glycerophosphoryl diester phosphodiesterase
MNGVAGESSVQRSADSIAIVAHRGLHHSVPENSLSAFRCAREAGFDWVEFDLWESSDGVPVICHDPTLDRLFDANGDVGSRTTADLARVHFRGTTESIPVGLANLDGLLLVEIKPRQADELISRVIELLKGRRDPWMLQSFHQHHLSYARSIAPKLSMAWLVETREQIEQGIADQCPAIHARHDLLMEADVRAMRLAGIGIGAWTVNEPEDLRRIIQLRPDMIITDMPELARQLIEREPFKNQ